MATYGYTFNSGDGVTPTRLNAARTVSDIVNADISATAAIAGTKIDPNFGSQNVVTTGLVGAGTTSPSTSIHVSSTSPSIRVQDSNGSGDTATGIVEFYDSSSRIGYFGYASQTNSALYIFNESASATGAILFGTNGSECARFDSNGNLGLGTSVPATKLHVNGTIRYTNRPAAGTITAIGFDANGDLKAASSSLRYKHNVAPYSKGLAEVAQLEPVTFNYNGEELANAGLIVEELAELGLEEFVLRDAEGTADAIPYGNMVALLINAIKELKDRVEALEAA